MAQTKAAQSSWTDERVEKLLGTLLLTGVMISGLVVLIGGVLYLLRYGRDPVHYENFDPQQSQLAQHRRSGEICIARRWPRHH